MSDLAEAVHQYEFLFKKNLPERPYCTDVFAHGLRVEPRSVAMRRRYIEAQPPWVRLWMVFDVDRDASWYAPVEAGLPGPTWMAINRQNGHGHLAYGIKRPVLMGPANLDKPKRYLADVERAMTVKLQADVFYAGFIAKNPLHRSWATVWNPKLYSLSELHNWLDDDLSRYRLPARTVGVGRNVETFDTVRQWAYRAVLQHKTDGGSLVTWQQACTGAAEHFTAEHHCPELHRSECRWIGRSVGKWTWVRFTPERFAEIQAHRGKAGGKASGKARREAAAEKTRRILALHESGATQRAIAAAIGVSLGTVNRVVRLGRVQ